MLGGLGERMADRLVDVPFVDGPRPGIAQSNHTGVRPYG